jgi:hypothetical protein
VPTSIVPVAEWDISAAATKEGEVNAVSAKLYAIGKDSYHLVIAGNGKMKNWSASNPAPWNEYVAFIQNLTVVKGVTSLGNYAFYDCDGLTEVRLPLATSIGQQAFYSCSNLVNVQCGEKLTKIYAEAFRDCAKLEIVTVAAGTDIAADAFANCTSLSTVNYGGTEAEWLALGVVLGEGVTVNFGE